MGRHPMYLVCGEALFDFFSLEPGARSSALAFRALAGGYLIASDAPTALAMVGVDAQGTPQYSFRGEGCADRQLRREHLPQLSERVRGLHVGSYSLVVTPVADTLSELVSCESAQRMINL